jgi:GntR family transcriptional regulator
MVRRRTRKDYEMLIVVDPHSGVPVYRQIMDQIRFHISSGLMRPGEELPSTRILSQQLGINPMTISKAYGFLERDGVVERRPGRPLVVSGFDREEGRERRIDQLRESLAPSVTAALQLGIEPEEAVRIFDGMLHGHDGDTNGKQVFDSREDRR